MKRLLTALGACLMTVAAVVAPVQAQEGDDFAEQGAAAEEVEAQIEGSDEPLDLDEIDDLDDLGPNPWLSFTENRNPKAVAAWRKVAAQLPDRAMVPRGKGNIGGPPLVITESEAPGETGVNDTVATGEPISDRFGTKPGDKGVVTINGSLSGAEIRPPIQGDCESTEDDGSISQANSTPAAVIQVALCVGEIGDGPFGDTSGDIDFYAFGQVDEGTLLILDAVNISGSLEPVATTVLGIYDAAGNLLVSAEDSLEPDNGGFIQTIAPAAGEYFAAVAGCCDLPSDPDDSSSGAGVTEVGTYELFVVAFPPPCTSSEDDGSIGLANDTNVPTQDSDICTGIIGDGPYGAADTDFYALGTVDAGEIIVVDGQPFEPGLTTVVGLYNSAGELVASYEETGDFDDPAGFIEFPVTATDKYYVGVAGCCELPADPNDPASGVASDQSGAYEVFMDAFTPVEPCVSTEDDGSIPLANPTPGFDEDIIFVSECFGAVGDGPQADLNGDVDFFQTRELPAGRILLVDFLDVFGPTNAGDLTIGIYDAEGNLLATGQDDPSQGGPDSDFFSITVPADGIYHVAVGGAMPTDPFDETTGTDTTITSPYEVMFIVDADESFFGGGFSDWSASSIAAQAAELRADYRRSSPLAALAQAMEEAEEEAQDEAGEADEPVIDVDYYLVDLRKGDAISGGFDASRVTGIIDPDGVQRSGSPFNPSFIYPVDSPLRHDRRTGLDHVATQDGVHAVFVTEGAGEYEGELRIVRSGLADERNRDQQIIFLDFDGAAVAGDTFGIGVDAELSPLSDFLAGWDLDASDEDAVIDATIDAVVETLDQDLRIEDGRNGDRDATNRGGEFDVLVLNSRDHGDRWGDDNVSRIVIGGTIDQLQIPTIGIAQSIDPGNTDTTETGVVLLDVMSAPAGSSGASINSYPVADGTTKAEFVGFVVGHITAHEIGHYIGNWHQETFNEIQALMDAGGDFAAIAGVGEDGTFGTADDTDPDFVEDIFSLNEGVNGVEDTIGRSVYGVSTGTQRIPGKPGGR